MDDADLTTHLLYMCLIKWQTQYDLTENTTLVSNRALQLVLVNVENSMESDYKSQNSNKSKGAEEKCNMESIDSWIPKKPKTVGWTNKHCVLCKRGQSKDKTHVTVIV